MRRMISAVLCFLTLCSVFAMSGCGSKAKSAPVLAKADHVFRGVDFSLPEEYSGYNSIFYDAQTNRICFLTSETVDKESYTTRPVIYSVDSSGENPEVKALMEAQNGDDGNNYSISAYTLLPSGDAWVGQYYNSDTGKQGYSLTIRDESGAVIFEGDLAEMFEASSDSSDYGSFYIQSITCDKSGNLYCTADSSVLVLSGEGKKLSEYAANGYLQNVAGGVDMDKVMITAYDYNAGGTSMFYLDPKTGNSAGSVSLPDSLSALGNLTLYAGPGFDIYYDDSESLYGYNEGGEPVELCNWLNSDISASYFGDFVIIDADHFLYTWYDDMSGSRKCSIMERVPEDQLTEKYVIKLSCVYSYSIKAAVVAFNKSSDKYRVEVDDYSKYMDSSEDSYQNTISKLDSDILSGNAPDVIINSGVLNISKYSAKGLLVDLYEKIDNDPDISREDFLSCVLSSLETDGKLYSLAGAFSVNTLAVLSDTVGDLTTWTVPQMLEIWKNQPEGTSFADYGNRDYMLELFISASLGDYIDYSAGKCDFDNDDFKALLEFVSGFPADNAADMEYYDNLESDRYRTGKTFINNAYISSFTDYLRIKDGTYGGVGYTLIGYPTSSGSGAKITAEVAASIMKDSPVIDGAWEFVKYLAENAGGSNSYNFPSTVAGLKAYAEEQKKEYYVFSADGNGYSTSTEPIDENADWVKQEGGKVSRLTDEDIDAVLEFFNSVKSSPVYDTKVLSMINEEASYYFSGQKTADETAKIIQSRVSLYISENY